MPRSHAPFCDLPRQPGNHGPFCVSRPVARQAVAASDSGVGVEVTVDLAVRWAELATAWLVRAVLEPPNVGDRLVVLMPPGTARQLAAALVTAAGQAEELDSDVATRHPPR